MTSAIEPVFVFGSNLAGRHGAGAAAFAAKWHGAKYGVGEGPTGTAYALPTKDAALNVLPLDAVFAAVARFLAYATAHPELLFEVTRVGCGLAGHVDADILPAFADAPANCLLPYTWSRTLRPDLPARVIVAGSRDFTDYQCLQANLDRLLSRQPDAYIVSGGAAGADQLGERYAHATGRTVLKIPADWQRYSRAAGMVRNRTMAHLASHLVAFWNGASPGTRNMLEVAKGDGLQVRTVLTTDTAPTAVAA